MGFIVIIFVMILLIFACYLFFMQRELKRLRKELSIIIKEKTNGVMHTEFFSKEIKKLVQVMNQQITFVKQKESMVEHQNHQFTKMIRNISHDLRTPLTSALGYIDILQKSDCSEEEKRKNLKIIEERLQRLSELIESFFEFAKIISDEGNIQMEVVNVVSMIEKSISNHYEDFSSAKRMIQFHTAKRKISMISNETMLLRVFDNLIRNAYKHSKGDLEIQITMEKELTILFQNKLLYSELDVDKIFDEFYTIDISRTRGNTGLGLAIAKEFVEQLGGHISAQKKQDNLQFILTFPLEE